MSGPVHFATVANLIVANLKPQPRQEQNMTTTPSRYRKRPVVIEAMRWDGTAADATPIIDWILGHGGTATYQCANPDRCSAHNGDGPHSIAILTLEGTMSASIGDWIIKGVAQEFYPCRSDVFEQTYEPAEVDA